jgi:nucleotidyltransferase/DNA polymerase involved in DNA repair
MSHITSATRVIPDLVIIQAHMELYRETSIKIFDRVKQECKGCAVQVSGIDEVYIDVTEQCANDDPFTSGALFAERIRKVIFESLGYTMSAGISHNRFLSKIAAGMKKPNGQTIITQQQVRSVLDPLPIRRIPGVGSKLDAKLSQGEIRYIHDIQELITPIPTLGALVGDQMAKLIVDLCNGIDDTPVQDQGAPKSLSSELTFLPINTFEMVDDKLSIIADDLSHRIERDRERYGDRIPTRLTVKYSTDNYNTSMTSISSEKNALHCIRKMTTRDDVIRIIRQISFSLLKSKLTTFRMFRLSVTVHEFNEISNGSIDKFLKNKKRSIQEEEDYRLALTLQNELLESRLHKRMKTSHSPEKKNKNGGKQRSLDVFFKK